MSRIVLYMSMSLDGFIAGPGDTKDNDHHDGVPIFVPTHQAPTGTHPGDVRFVTDGIESCAAQAKAAAGDRDVMLHGAYTA